MLVSPLLKAVHLSLTAVLHSLPKDTTHPTSCATYLQVRHISVALLRTGVIRKLHIPETWELVDKEGILFDDCIEDILAEKKNKTEKHLGMLFLLHEVISTPPPADCPPSHGQKFQW